MQDLLLVVDNPDGHLRAAEVRPEAQPHRKEFRRGMRY
jgi:hypothetical protein